MSLRDSHRETDPLSATEASERDRRVEAMFDSIAGRYDLLNRLLSLGIDRRWRRQLVATVAAVSPRRILDVATGTADVALALKAALPDSEVIGVDISEAMLAVAKGKIARSGLAIDLAVADGMALPFADAEFDAVTIAYGLRNFSDRQRGLREFHRVLRPGGRLALLDFPPLPERGFGRLLRFYCFEVLPRIGGLLSGRKGAYRYLPASTDTFPPPPELSRMMIDVGFERVDSRLQTFGISALHSGDKAP